MPFTSPCDRALRQAKEDARYYRERAAELEDTYNRQQEQRYEEQERVRRARIEDHARTYRTAATWPEALSKQAGLCRREETEEDDYFTELRKACETASALWPAAEAEAAPAIAALQRQIDDLKAQIARTVAVRLCDADPSSAAAEIAQLMLDPDTDLDEWLNW
jgi:chromosome segregation ATPase